MSESDLDLAETYLQSGEYDLAKDLLTQQILDESLPIQLLADANYLMGVLVQVCPKFGNGDECGLSYFKEALKLQKNHQMAALGVIGTFGERFPDHQDVDAVEEAIQSIQPMIKSGSIAPKMCEMVEAKERLAARLREQ